MYNGLNQTDLIQLTWHHYKYSKGCQNYCRNYLPFKYGYLVLDVVGAEMRSDRWDSVE